MKRGPNNVPNDLKSIKTRGGEVALGSSFYYESKQHNRNKLGDVIA